MTLEVAIHLEPTYTVRMTLAGTGGSLDLVDAQRIDMELAPVLRGVDGASAPAVRTFTADGAVSGHRVVRLTSAGSVGYCDPSDAEQAGAALGVTAGAAMDGGSVDVHFFGDMNEPSWSWVPGPVWLGPGGTLTQSRPASGLLQQIGYATSSTSMFINLRQPIWLAP
jgi:hypothetical protein